MSTEPRFARFPLTAPFRLTARAVSHWYVRWQLRRLHLQIDALQRRLAGEFALLEAAPQYAELARLQARCDQLESRLLAQP